MDTDYREEILTLLSKASLPSGDIDLWDKVLKNIPDEFIPNLYASLSRDPKAVTFYTENLKKKSEALLNNDEKMLDEALADDSAYIKALAPHLKINI